MFNGGFPPFLGSLRERAARERSGAVGVAQRSERAAFPPLPLPFSAGSVGRCRLLMAGVLGAAAAPGAFVARPPLRSAGLTFGALRPLGRVWAR